MTIKQKIVGKSLATSLLVAAVGLLSAMSMLRIGTTLRLVESTSLPEARSADQLEGAAARIDGLMDAYRDAVQSQRQTEADQLKAEVDAAFTQIELASSQLDRILRLGPATGDNRRLLESIKEQASIAHAAWSNLHVDGRGGSKSEFDALDGLSIATGKLMRSSLDLERGAKDEMMQGTLAAEGRVTTSVRLLTVAAVLAIIVAVGMALLVAMPLSARLQRLRDGTIQIGKGIFETKIKVDSGDEIGELATAFNEMASGLRRSQDEIRESESKFRELAETIHEVFWVSDPTSTKLQYVSPAYKQVWGRSCESAYKDLRSFAEAIIPEDRPRVLAGLENAARDGMDREYRIVRPDGTMRWIHDRGFPVRDESGRVTRIVGIAEDITERRLVEEALRLSEARLRLALDAAKLGTFDFRILTGELNWDEANKRIWGLPIDKEVDYREALKRVHPEDGPRIQQAVQASVDPQGTGYFEAEYRIIWPDGSVHWTIGRGQVHFEAEGERRRAFRMVGVQIDITDRRNAEDALQRAHEQLEQRVEARTAELQHANAALRQSESELQRAKDTAEAANQAKSIIFDTALDSIVSFDSHSTITAWNLQAETMFRWDKTEAVGLRLDETIIPKRHWEAHRREIKGFIKTGEGPLLSKVAELVAIRRDGHQFPVELAITPALSAGQWTFTAFIRDITVRKQAEVDLRHARDAAENASRAKSEFLANMSHEIRTPLNGVIGMSDLLLDTGLDEKQRRFAELIKSSGASLADLINDILDFSKIEARKLEIESVEFDLHAAVEDVMEMMLIKATPKGLDLGCLTLPDVPRQVKGDPQRVKQILINLVNNAIKFTESGSISTRLTVDNQSQDCVTVRFSITDTGIGIPADKIGRLFKSFSQVDASTTRSFGGTGLGLAICKQLAELMGGAVGVESEVGRGSTFWFTVKLGLVPETHRPAIAIDGRGLRILAVQSDAAMREILHDQLCSWQLEAAVASSGDEAMRMLHDAVTRAQPYDVAIIDSELPDIGALELGKAIKSSSVLAGTVLLILLPWGSDLDPLKLRNAGFSNHLFKPVRQSRLYNSIIDAIASTSQTPRPAETMPIIGDSPNRTVSGAPVVRILIAEDNRVNQIVASEVLTRHGYASDIVENGNKAIAAVLAGGYDLVLMDCSMPGMDGFEATRQIRRAEHSIPANPPRHIPIIALTANAIKGDRDRCLEAGMDDYVSKPLDPDLLVKTIQTQLATSSQAPSPLPVNEGIAAPSKPVLPNQPDETLPFAIEALLDRCMGNAETVTLILNEFEQQALGDLEEIKRNLAGGDHQATARVAHALKGASGILSAAALTGIALQLEEMGRSGVLTDADQLFDQLKNEVQRCVAYLPNARAAMAAKAEVCMEPTLKGRIS